jgi:hypothetical protein
MSQWTWSVMFAYDPKRTSAVHFAGLGHRLVVRITSSSSSLSGTKPLPPHVGHCCSSSVPFSMTPSPLHSGQVFKCASLWILREPNTPTQGETPIAVLLALSSTFGFGAAFVLTQVALRWMPPWLGAAVSVPTSTLLFWCLAPFLVDITKARTRRPLFCSCELDCCFQQPSLC